MPSGIGSLRARVGMLELPRALILDSDRAFSSVIADKLRRQSPEIATLHVTTVEEALSALDALRPHIVFLDWSVQNGTESPSALLRKMSDLMASDPSGYVYPLLVNSNWREEYEHDWSDRGVIFQMENPRVVIDRFNPTQTESVISRWYVRRILPSRVIRLARANIDLARSGYLRIADAPPRILSWDVHAQTEHEFERHREDTFQLISQQLLSPMGNIASVASARSLFVKANQRNTWVNLAYVETITYDAAGERSFMFTGPCVAQRLNVTVTHAVARMLESMRHLNLWPHLNELAIPD